MKTRKPKVIIEQTVDGIVAVYLDGIDPNEVAVMDYTLNDEEVPVVMGVYGLPMKRLDPGLLHLVQQELNE
jgi:hypothetical protein